MCVVSQECLCTGNMCCTASREKIQPKIKTHLSASSRCVFVHPYFVLIFMLAYTTVFRVGLETVGFTQVDL